MQFGFGLGHWAAIFNFCCQITQFPGYLTILLLCCIFSPILHVQENTEFLKRVACLFKNEFPTVAAPLTELLYQEKLLKTYSILHKPNALFS